MENRNGRRGGVIVESHSASDRLQMRKNVGLVRGISFVIGSIIGSGIFISPKGVLQGTGSVGLSLIVWISSGVISLFGSLSYAELGTMLPQSGAEYVYIYEAYFPMLAFLFAWTRAFIIMPASLAIRCQVFSSYLVTLFEVCGTEHLSSKRVAVIALIALCVLNCYSTKWAADIQVLLTICQLVTLMIIIVGGLVSISRQDTLTTMEMGFNGTSNNPSGIALSFYDAMFAYDGWNVLNCITGELKHPYTDLPRANTIGVSIITVIYIFTNVSYFAVLGLDGVMNSDAVAIDWAKKVLGAKVYLLMPVAILLSTFGAANGYCYASARLIYAAGRKGHLPEVLSYIHVKRYTPLPSVVLTCFLAILMIMPADISSLIDFFSFTSWIFYAIAVSCVIVLRFRRPKAERKIKVFILIPILFVLCALYLVIGPIIDNPQIELLYAGLFIVGGLLFYFPFVVFKLDRGCFDGVTMVIQLLCDVAPPQYEADD